MDDHVEVLLRDPASTGLFLDFDGTLSHIVEVPSDARPAPGARDLLKGLSRKFGLTSVVSGRSAVELLEWLGPDVEIWGLHGAERTIEGRVEVSPRATPYVSTMRRVRGDVARRVEELQLEGVILEDKGVMLTVHYRTASRRPEAKTILEKLVAELASDYGLIHAEGRMSFELRPPVEFSKGDVVLERSIQLRLTAVAFAGDDAVDLPAFDALDALAAGGAATVRVAVASREAPPDLLHRADIVVDGPAGMMEWLRTLGD